MSDSPPPYTFAQYEARRRRTAALDKLPTCDCLLGQHAHIIRALLGLFGEGGELADLFKKALFHGAGHEVDRDKALRELGDAQWYIGDAAHALRSDMGEVAQRNDEKLTRRYPDGFTPEASRARVDAAAPLPRTPSDDFRDDMRRLMEVAQTGGHVGEFVTPEGRALAQVVRGLWLHSDCGERA